MIKNLNYRLRLSHLINKILGFLKATSRSVFYYSKKIYLTFTRVINSIVRLTISSIRLLFNILLAIYEVILSIPYYYSEYKSHKHRNLKTRFKEIARITKLAYKHQIKPIVTKGVNFSLGINFKKLYNPRVYRSLGLVAIALVFLFTIFNPNETLKATSLTWSNNADFSANRPGKCGETTSSNIIVSGNSYIDPACSDPGEDASLSLQKGGAYFSEVKEVSSGAYHTLILRNDGTVWAWGSNSYGQLGNNSNIDERLPAQVKDPSGNGFLNDVKSVSSGAFHSLALKNDGTVWAWGLNRQIWTNQWTGNGQIGDNTNTNRSLPTQVRNSNNTGFLTDIVQIAAGSYSSYGIRSDGTVWGWGSGINGQLGVNSVQDAYRPVQMRDPSGTGFLSGAKKISATKSWHLHSNAIILMANGTVFSVGYNANGQLGDGTPTQRNLPVQVKDSTGSSFLNLISDISASYHTLALKNDGTVWAWGLNTNGQLGDGSSSDRSLPVKVKDSGGQDIANISSISAGGNLGASYSLALKNDGTVWAWGLNTNGQLGQNNVVQSLVPVQVKNENGSGYLDNVAFINNGVAQSFAIKSDGSIYGWGANSGSIISNGGQAGFGEGPQPANRLLPTKLLSRYTNSIFNDVKQVSAGDQHVLALKNDGTVWAWGANGNGQLGDGSTKQSYLPVQVKDSTGTSYLNNIISIETNGDLIGGSSSFAVASDGTVWAWGSGSYGKLGNGGTGNSQLPLKVKDSTGNNVLSNISKVSSAGSYVLALASDGTVWGWGHNGTGNLGDNTTIQRNLPVRVKDSTGLNILSDVKDIQATKGFIGVNSIGFSLALKNDGTVWAWGTNWAGQLGIGLAEVSGIRALPVQVKDSSGQGFLNNITAISTGSAGSVRHSAYALSSDGAVWSWGDNLFGQLGDGTSISKNLPVQVKNSSNTGSLNNIVRIEAGFYSVYAIDSSNKSWSWGANWFGALLDNTAVSRALPVRTKDINNQDLSDTTMISSNGYVPSGQNPDNNHVSFSIFLQSNGTLISVGFNGSGQLGNYSNVNSLIREDVLSSVIFTDGHLPLGESSGYIVDQGPTKKTKWLSVTWNTNPLPAKTSVKFSTRTSSNGVNWSNWIDQGTQTLAGSTGDTADLTDLPFSRFIELKVTLANTDFFSSPTLNSFSLSLLDDTTTPPTNASNIVMKKSVNGQVIQEESWNNSAKPYFTWQAAEDNAGGSGIGAYCLYLGQDSTADVMSTKGILGNSPVDTDGKCQFAVPSSELDLSVDGMLSEAIASSNNNYYLLIKALDNSGNLYDGNPASFVFKHDVNTPNNVSFVSLPSQFIASKDVTITWPTTGPQAASDTNSGLAGLQYRIGNNGTWQGLNHNGNQDLSDLLPNSGSYQTDPTHDYPLLSDGNNLIYFRAIDNAGNISTSLTSAVIKINSSAPSSPQSLNVTPQSNTANSFAFTWQQPATFVGSAANLTYCYTINTLPTVNTCTYTAPGQTGLGASAYANQPGENTFYVVAKDEAGNINYATASSITFEANTPAPGLPLNLEVSDISIKASQDWKLALSWAKPTNQGAGVSQYRIYRSTNPTTGFTQIASTSGQGYFDADLNQVEYYYKVKACDSANNCGAETPVVSKLPTGRFTSPAAIIGSPSAQVSTRKVTVNWVTERESDSKIQYGTESGKYRETEVSNSTQTKSHTLNVEGLEAGTTYYYRVLWTDEDGNTGRSSEMMFTTLPAPVVKNVSVIRKSLNSATIQFTSKDSTAVNILYGRTESFGGLEAVNTSATESTYTVELEGLDDGVTYFFRPDAIDTDGFVYGGNIVTFTTPERPRISELRFQPIEGEPTSTQQVTWRTNVPTTSQVTYGLVNTNGTSILDTTPKTEHSLIIKDLQDNSSYFLLAQGRDQDGNLATSDRQTFQTALDSRPPKVLDVTVESTVKGTGGDARGQIVITWKTDEPSTSQVIYGDGGGSGNYNRSTAESSGLKTEHTVVISDLNVSRVYTLRPVSKDGAGNETRGAEQSAIVGRPTDSTLNIILNILTRIFGL